MATHPTQRTFTAEAAVAHISTEMVDVAAEDYAQEHHPATSEDPRSRHVTSTRKQSAPLVHLARIPRVLTVEVLRSELDALTTATHDTSVALAFFTTFIGALFGTAGCLFSSTTTSTSSALIAMMTTTVALALFFGVSWFLRSRRQSIMLNALKARCGSDGFDQRRSLHGDAVDAASA